MAPNLFFRPIGQHSMVSVAQAAVVGSDTPRLLLTKDAEVPAMNTGYGNAGQSVQEKIPGYHLMPDREIMRRVLLRGEAVVSLRKVCDALKLKPDKSDPAITKPMSLKMSQAQGFLVKERSRAAARLLGRSAFKAIYFRVIYLRIREPGVLELMDYAESNGSVF